MLSKIVLYYHTISYLKLSQVLWRIRYRLFPSKTDLSSPPGIRQMLGIWAPPIKRFKSFTEGRSFSFLNETKHLDIVGWNGSNCEKLWRYNQHYFDDLNSTCASDRYDLHIDLMHDWVANNHPGQGTGWEPYPTSLRIVNWIKWCFAGYALPYDCLHSLAVQTRWLSRNLEWHILANHLFANAKALIFAGMFYSGKEAKQWLNIGLGILRDEIPEQILPDGGHFELSPMYHSIVLEDVLDLINIFQAFPGIVEKELLRQLQSVAIKMMKWLDVMCHPDGGISFFNDAAFNIAPSLKDFKTYSIRLNIKPYSLGVDQNKLLMKQCPDSGYVVLAAPHAKVLLDLASIGPDYQPGHGHADTLSFEMSVFGKRVFVNCGTSQYGTGMVRQKERGTATHNTVVINNENSSEVWAGFRVARRAKPFELVMDKNKTSIKVSCAHDGYKRLSGSPKHLRSWTMSSGKLLIKDKIKGDFKSATGYFHFHPDVKITNINEGFLKLNLPECNRDINIVVSDGSASIVSSIFCSEFGIQLPTRCLKVEFDDLNEIAVEMIWNAND